MEIKEQKIIEQGKKAFVNEDERDGMYKIIDSFILLDILAHRSQFVK